jgi:oligopeptide transport system substrate-binding protein
LDYDIARSDWYGDYMDPGTFLDMFTTGNGQNRTGWSNAEYDRLIAAAAVEADNARRFELFHESERILCEQELPILPLFFKRGNYLLRPEFGGVADNLRDVLQIHRIVRRRDPAR